MAFGGACYRPSEKDFGIEPQKDRVNSGFFA
jgi:hypothetical protein